MILETAPPALPPIRSRIEDAKRDLDEYGLARLSGTLPAATLERARRRLVDQAAGEDAAGMSFYDSGDDAPGADRGPNQRVFGLVNKGEVFQELALHPASLELVRHLLGPHVQLSSFTANIARRGGRPQRLHADQGWMPAETPFAVAANAIWMLGEFSDENGATRVVPGSHTLKAYPEPRRAYQTLPATGPAGTLLVFDGRLWHGTGSSQSDEARYGLLTYYCRAFMRPQENHTLTIAPEVLETASPELLELLGFQVWNSLGGLGGTAHGRYIRRPRRYRGELSAPADQPAITPSR